ncbi:hypothetical protein VNO78_36363 [Psophocarpus tetragonolobus]|uniref:Uncharacterized protein n=1 Tax=Psophocarpus tetragonolobus TaxID=3891 RepID=A0AAN9NE67_PSOTE
MSVSARLSRLVQTVTLVQGIRSTRRETPFRTAAESSDLSTRGFVEFLWIAYYESSHYQPADIIWLVLPQQGTPRRRFYSWAAVSRSRGRSAPCPRIWVICSQKFLLQSDLAGERSQFAAENKTASERTFVRFFSTKHGSLRITVGRWLPKETPIRSAPQLGGIYLIPITRRGSP